MATKRKVTVIPHSEREWLRLPVAREMLGDVATSTIYKMKDRGLLETRKYGHVRLFSVESINKLISRSRNSVNRTAFLEHGHRG